MTTTEKLCRCCYKPLSGQQKNYCSRKCLGKFTASRRRTNTKNGLMCKSCGKELYDTQTQFCTNKCKCSYYYLQNTADLNASSYASQQARGIARKKELISRFDSRCTVCGYNRNLASFTFHHIDPATKLFPLEMRELATRSMAAINEEVKKCTLMCHNCHDELHYPHLSLVT